MGDRIVVPIFKDLSNPPPKKRYRIRPVSAKRQRRIDAWRKVDMQLRTAGRTRCEACDVHHLPECNGRFEHKHHVRRKSQGGPDTIENCLPVSSAHHDWIHAHVKEAKALGFLAVTEHPADQP